MDILIDDNTFYLLPGKQHENFSQMQCCLPIFNDLDDRDIFTSKFQTSIKTYQGLAADICQLFLIHFLHNQVPDALYPEAPSYLILPLPT